MDILYGSIGVGLIKSLDVVTLLVEEMWDLSDDWTYRTAAYFRDHVINLRFHFSERSEVSLVVKSHVCVRMEQEAWWLQQKNVFLGSK